MINSSFSISAKLVFDLNYEDDSAGSNFGRVISLLAVWEKHMLGDSFRCSAYDEAESSSVVRHNKISIRLKNIMSSTIKLKKGRNSVFAGMSSIAGCMLIVPVICFSEPFSKTKLHHGNSFLTLSYSFAYNWSEENVYSTFTTKRQVSEICIPRTVFESGRWTFYSVGFWLQIKNS